jgi:spermidine synthase
MAHVVAIEPKVEAPTRSNIRLDWLTPLLVLIFVLSGTSGLMYQIAWIKVLSLTFGVTIYAVSIVVAAFMGGLALGSFVGGRVADRLPYPVIWYALVELAIALLGMRSVDGLDWVQSVYLANYPRDAEQAVLQVVAMRFALAAVVVIIPTTLMGATLPLMVRGSLAFSREVGARVSWLYASNTAGAIIGTLVAGFFLIGAIGVRSTIGVAAYLNAAAAATALIIGLLTVLAGRRGDATEAEYPERTNGAAALAPSSMVRAVVIATFAVQGFASLAYEVIWTRVFGVLLDGTTYAFSIVLAVVLLGIALGSALISPFLHRHINWLRAYALLQAGVALFGFMGVFAIARIYGISSRLSELPAVGPEIGEFGWAWMAAAAGVVILPVMLLLGASFPVAARIVVPSHGGTGRWLGLLYAGNTAGAILGAWIAGFFLLPSLGSQRAIELIAGINGLLAVALALSSGHGRALPATLAAGVGVAYVSLFANLVPNMYERMLAGRFPGTEMVWVGEGMESTVTIVRHLDNGQQDMYFNGQSQASDSPSVLWFHRLLGHLPMALNRNPQDVLIVGVGGGATASALASHQPQRLDIVELSEIAMEGTRYYQHVNGNILDFPQVHIRIDDARNYLLLTDRKYDVVTADAIHPRSAGTSLLYSYDYFAHINRALRPGGMMAQWLKDDGSFPDNDQMRHLITRTFAAAFPYVTMWVNGSLLIGSNEPINPNDGSIETHWNERGLQRFFDDQLGLESPDAVKNLFLLNDKQVREWAGEGPLMTDDHPYAEYFLSMRGLE